MSVIAIASMLATQAPITLLFQPKVGSTYKQSTTMSQTSQMGNSSTSMVTTSKVLAFENGFYKLQNTPSNVQMTGGPAGSSDQAKKAMSKPSIIYIDRHFKPKMDTKGGAGMQQMMSGLNSSFAGVAFPSKPVKIGETWTNSIDMGSMMGGAKGAPAGMKANGKITMVYKLLKVDSSSATVGMTISGTVNMDMAGSRGGAGGGQAMKMSMTMKGGGTSSMERATGIPIGSNIKMTMGMNFAGQPVNMNQTITTKRI